MSMRSGRSGSANSRTLKSSRSNYKLIGKQSEVDETLFGNGTGKSRSGRPRSDGGGVSFVSKEQMANMIGADSVVISGGELMRLKEAATVITPAEAAYQASLKAEQKASTMAVARARKEKIISMEAERKKNEAKSDLEMEAIEKDKHTMGRADFLVDEQRDDVKRMNQFVRYSKCATIRDAQLEEKKALQRQEEEEEMRLDEVMEHERVRAVELYEQREAQRAVDRKHGKDVIVEQIKARERERLLQQEILEQERDGMLRQLERLKEEDLLKAEMKKEAAKKLMGEVASSNSQMIRMKELKRRKEIDEDQRIASYLEEKAAREQAHQDELDRIAAEKEAETVKLRQQQEKASDKKSELDALRAKRSMEQFEREWRQKERAAIEKQKMQNKILHEARVQQKKEKERRLETVAKSERNEFDRIVQVQREAEAVESEKEYQMKDSRYKHRRDVQEQISKNEGRRRQERLDYLEEGRKLRKEIEKEKSHLLNIKDRKVEELRTAGVPDKYLTELMRHKVEF